MTHLPFGDLGMVNIPPIFLMGGFGMVSRINQHILHHLCQDWWNWHRPMDRLDIHSTWRVVRDGHATCEAMAR